MLKGCVSCLVGIYFLNFLGGGAGLLHEICHQPFVVAGLVDAHTHPVWAGDRVHEFAMKVTVVLFFFP